jgi:hypothetical protein
MKTSVGRTPRSPWTRSWGSIEFISEPTGASAADQGVRPSYVFNGVTMGLRPTKSEEDAEKPEHRSLTLAARKEIVTEPRP